MTEANENLEYENGLRKLRKIRRLLFWVILTFLPVMVLLAFLPVPESLSLLIGAAWIVAGIVIELIIGFTRCPACGKYFHVGRGSGNIFARYCVNCGIPLWPQQ